MNVPELLSRIKKKDIPKVLVLVGNEYAIMNEYVEQIGKRLCLEKYSVASACSVLTPNKVMTLTRKPRLYISKYEKQIQVSEKCWEYSKNLGNNYLIIILTQVDKRNKFYKFFESNIVEFENLDYNAIRNAVGSKVALSDKYMARLISGCDNNYGRVLLEIQKIKSLSEEESCTEEEAYKRLLSYGVIYEEPSTQIQEFISLVMLGDYKCFDVLSKLKKNSESSFVLISWLYTNIRNQLIVQTVSNVSPQSTGLNYYAVKECLSRKSVYSVLELVSALAVIKKVEQGLKNGLYEDSWAMDYILINIL